MVYFILANDVVKIGYTKSNVQSRMSSLQTGNSVKLKLLKIVKGNRRLERDIHKFLASSHVRGEWFKYDRKVKKLIDGDITRVKYNTTALKDTTKYKILSFRPSNVLEDLLDLYMEENYVDKTRAIHNLIELGGSVWLSKLYDEGN